MHDKVNDQPASWSLNKREIWTNHNRQHTDCQSSINVHTLQYVRIQITWRKIPFTGIQSSTSQQSTNPEKTNFFAKRYHSTCEPEPIHGSLPRRSSTISVYNCSFGAGSGAPKYENSTTSTSHHTPPGPQLKKGKGYKRKE